MDLLEHTRDEGQGKTSTEPVVSANNLVYSDVASSLRCHGLTLAHTMTRDRVKLPTEPVVSANNIQRKGM